MSNFEAMQRIADRYISDAEFRAQMASDLEGTAKRHGVQVDDARRRTLSSIGGLSDQALSQRVSKRTTVWC